MARNQTKTAAFEMMDVQEGVLVIQAQPTSSSIHLHPRRQKKRFCTATRLSIAFSVLGELFRLLVIIGSVMCIYQLEKLGQTDIILIWCNIFLNVMFCLLVRMRFKWIVEFVATCLAAIGTALVYLVLGLFLEINSFIGAVSLIWLLQLSVCIVRCFCILSFDSD